jgi:hypothetical protein
MILIRYDKFICNYITGDEIFLTAVLMDTITERKLSGRSVGAKKFVSVVRKI